jgi:hypothetical protein
VLCTTVKEGAIKQKSTGYLHRLAVDVKPIRVPKQTIHPHNSLKIRLYAATLMRNKADIIPLADQLGIETDNLLRFGAGKLPDIPAWGFPMYNNSHEIVGIKCRDSHSKKWCIPGSRLGLYICTKQIPNGERWFVCEGESDSAALGQVFGSLIVGRPCVNAGGNFLVKFLRGSPATLFADTDKDDIGLIEAKKLLKQLNPDSNIVYNPQYKDVRAWIQSGTFPENYAGLEQFIIQRQ